MAPMAVAPLLAPKKLKVAKVAEAEMTMVKEKKIEMSVYWMKQLWKMPTIFVIQSRIYFIFEDFFGKVQVEKAKGRAKDARKRQKRIIFSKKINDLSSIDIL